MLPGPVPGIWIQWNCSPLINNGSVKSHKVLQGGETINEYEQVICATFQFIALEWWFL